MVSVKMSPLFRLRRLGNIDVRLLNVYAVNARGDVVEHVCPF